MRQLVLPGLLLFASGSPAFAITCHGDYQVVAGQEMSTPDCRAHELAAVARKSSSRDSDSPVRNHPSRNKALCR